MSAPHQRTVFFWLSIILCSIFFFWLFQGILAPFIIGFAVAYLLNPVVEKCTGCKIPRWLSAIFILLTFILIVFICLLFAIPMLIREMSELTQLIPSLWETSHLWISEKLTSFKIAIPQSFEELKSIDPAFLSEKSGDVLNAGKTVLGGILKGGAAIIGFLSFLILMPIVAFYMMVDWPRITQKIHDLIPRQNKKRIETILSDIDTSLSGFIRGQLTVCVLLGGFYAIGLSLLGLQYGFFVGVVSGLLSIIPYVGSIFGLIASVGLAFYQFGGWEYPLIAFIIFVVGQLIEGNYLTPKLVGESVGLHPLWVIFVLMAGGALLGLLGMMIAVPVAVVIAVLIRHIMADYKQSSYYKNKK